MKCTVPPYFENVLRACGFENGFAIASIEDEDVKYFEEEVRNGNVSKYFQREKEINILDGSTKTEANFEFTRGHKKFLLYIRDFLKNYFKQINSDASISESQLITKTDGNQKHSNEKSERPQTDWSRHINIHQGIVICKVIMSLIDTIPSMYAMVSRKYSTRYVKAID